MAAGHSASPLWMGPALTVVAAALTEFFWVVVPLPAPVPVAILIAALLAVAYTALISGFWMGVVSAIILGSYCLHRLDPLGFFSLEPSVLQGAITVGGIGVAMAAPMSIVRKREDRLRRALRERAEELEARNEQLTEANAALEAFGYVVSHDLKEPVRGLENYLAAADEEYGTDEGRRLLAEARDANVRLSQLLHGLLGYSRASTTPVTPRRLTVPDILASGLCRALYEGLLRERDAKLEVDPHIPPVHGDEVVLAQVLGNVILNALRHNPAAGPIVRIRAGDAPPGRVHVVVEDNGPGFPADVLRRFTQLKGTRPTTVKGGFGLVISQRAMLRIGGTMWLENAGGGCVHLELPAAPAPTITERASELA